jgi:hypothetical protein
MTWQAELEALIEETMAHVKAIQGNAVQPIVPIKPVAQALAEPPRSTPFEPMNWPSVGSEREEIGRRVASFRAVQERMQRERENYCVKTLANACRYSMGAPSKR